MRTRSLLFFSVAFWLLLSVFSPVLAQTNPLDYHIDWTTFDSGTTPISAEGYTLHASIGQPDAHFYEDENETYTLTGGHQGFLAASEVQFFIPLIIKTDS